jgi:hypothetical protein
MYAPFKFLVQPVLFHQAEDGTILGEAPAETVTLYGLAALANYALEFPDFLADLNTAEQPDSDSAN